MIGLWRRDGSFVSADAAGASRKDLLDSLAADLQSVVTRAEAAGVTRAELRDLLGILGVPQVAGTVEA